jgi:hypothetical protein
VGNGWGGKRPGSGRPKGSPGLKSEALAERLDALGCDPAEALVRLGNKAEAAGEIDLAIKAFTALMGFRWPKLKETAVGLGVNGSMEVSWINVTTGIERPPDDAVTIDATPVPPPSPPEPEPPAPRSTASPTTSAPKPRPAASPPPPEPPGPALTPGKPVPAHVFWSQPAKSALPPVSEYDPWKEPT